MNNTQTFGEAIRQEAKRLRRILGFGHLLGGTSGKTPNPQSRRKTDNPFDLKYPLLAFSPDDIWTLGDAVTGAHVFGGNGSGKTTGPYRTIIRQFIRCGYGGIVFTTKPDEYATLKGWCEELGAADRLIRFAPEEKFRFGFLGYEQRRGGQRGGSLTETIVSMISTIQESTDRDGTGGGDKDPFWKNAGQQLTRNSVDLALLGQPHERLSMSALHEIIMSAPVSHEQVDSLTWQENSLNYRLHESALRDETLTPRQKADLRIVGRYWLNEFPLLSPETRGSVVAMFTTVADLFTRGMIGELFGGELNIIPEVTHSGAILCIDLPVKVFGRVGIAAQIVWKYLWQQACERRDVNANPRPVFLAADEFHNIVNSHDVLFQTTARSSRCCSIYMTQSLSNYNFALGSEKGKELATALLAVCQNQFFCSSADPKTNQWASDLFAKSFQSKFQSGINRNDKGGGGSNAGASESLEYNVQPAEFLTLRKGGPANGYLVDVIAFQGGRVFNASGQTFIRTAFRQI